MQELMDIQEMILEHDQLPFRMFAEGDMFEIIENYKEAPIGKPNQAEIEDLETMNNKNKSWIMVLEEGQEIPAEKAVMNFGRCSVGEHNRIKKQFRNNLKVTPLKITKMVFDTKERITTKIPVGAVNPGQVIEIEIDWKPLVGRRKPLNCNTLVIAEPVWSKRMDWAMYHD